MDTSSEFTVPAGALVVALAWVEGLHGRAQDAAQPEDLVGATHEWGRDTMAAAFATLIGVAVSQLGTPADEPDLLHTLVPAVITRLQRTQLDAVPDSALPTVAGLLTAAVLGQDVCRWRLSLGPWVDADMLVCCYTLWLLVDLFDEMMGVGWFATTLAAALNAG